jgi:hypothetical protein
VLNMFACDVPGTSSPKKKSNMFMSGVVGYRIYTSRLVMQC